MKKRNWNMKRRFSGVLRIAAALILIWCLLTLVACASDKSDDRQSETVTPSTEKLTEGTIISTEAPTIEKDPCSLGHTPGEWETEREASCTEDGRRVLFCTVCRTELESQTLFASGHAQGAWVTTKEAACLEDGKQTLSCATCKVELESRILAATGHTNGDRVVVNATCTKDGKEYLPCKTCGVELESSMIPAPGHTESETVLSAPTCTSDGKNLISCSACGESRQVTVPSPGHTDGEWVVEDATCEKDGKKTLFCSVCSKEVKSEVLTALGHVEGEWRITPATCTQNGEKIMPCKMCGAEIKIDIIVSPGHTPGERYTREATCSDYGGSFLPCSVCNTILESEIVTLPHDYALDDYCITCGVVRISEGLEYSYDETLGGYVVVGRGDWTGSWLSLPKIYNGAPVVAVGESAFAEDKNLVRVYLPSTVASIGDDAFLACRNLEIVNLEQGLRSIGHFAFDGCYSLRSMEIPASVISVGVNVVNWAGDYPFLDKEDGVVYFGNWVIKFHGTQTHVTLREGTVGIADQAFFSTDVKQVFLPYGAKVIGDSAFQFCRSLEYIDIPNTVTHIYQFAFNACESLVYIKLPYYLTSIEYRTFYCCHKLESVNIPDGVISIGEEAFMGCEKLQKLTLPDGLKYIEADAFCGCKLLQKINIPGSVVSIGSSAFRGCDLLGENEGGVIYLDEWVIDFKNTHEQVVIREGTVGIAYDAFGHSQKLVSVILPKSLKFINTYAFEFCTSLIEIRIPHMAVYIDEYSFIGCASLESIVVDAANPIYHSAGNCLIETASGTLIAGCKNSVIPDDGSVTVIEKLAFHYCTNLAQLFIPKTIVSIGEEAFIGCFSLESIVVDPQNAFYHIEGNCLIETASGTLLAAAKSFSIPENVSAIGRRAFYYREDLTEIVFSKNITQIRYLAFSGCSNLTSVYYEGSAEEWGMVDVDSNAFSWSYRPEIYFYAEEQPNGTGCYWRYVDGVPTVW